MTEVKLTYFDWTGLAEPVRLILSYGRIPFEDIRVTHEEWMKLKGELAWPQLPILEIEGKKLYQSKAICRFLAKRLNLCGSTEWDATLCDIMVDTIYDFRSKVATYFHLKDREERDGLYSSISNEVIPCYLERFERHILSHGGYFVGGKLTWADIVFLAFSENVSQMVGKDLVVDYPKLKTLQRKVSRYPGINEWYTTHKPVPKIRTRTSWH